MVGCWRCVVQGCNRKMSKSATDPVKIYSIPSVRKHDEDITSRRRVLWLKRLNLSEKDVLNGGVCDVHFISGKPSHFVDEAHPDWAPTQKIGSKNLLSKSALERYNRRKKFQVLKANKRVENLIKEKNSKNVDLHLSTVSSSSEIVPLDQINLHSKEIAKQKIQKPAVVLKKPEELVNENQLDIFWMHKLPVKNSSQVSRAKVIKLDTANNLNGSRQSKINSNGHTLAKRVECQKGGVGSKQKVGLSNRRPMVVLPLATLEQVLRDPCEDFSLFISNSAANDHDYCTKPEVSKELQHIYMDHDYCQPFHSNGSPSSISGNISEFSLTPPHAEIPTPIPLELTGNESREDAMEVVIYQNGSPSTSKTNGMCDFILPNDAQCKTCDEVEYLKSELEKKSLVLDARRNDVNSLKRELEIAKENISNLRAQLEENTRTLWSCLSENGKSSS